MTRIRFKHDRGVSGGTDAAVDDDGGDDNDFEKMVVPVVTMVTMTTKLVRDFFFNGVFIGNKGI